MLHVHTFISGVQKPSKMGILRSDYPNVYINQCSIVLHAAISCWRTFLDCVLLIVYYTLTFAFFMYSHILTPDARNKNNTTTR